MWFYDDRATRLQGRVVLRFPYKGRDHVILECVGVHGSTLVVREACAVSDDPLAVIGFGAHDEDLTAEIADIVRPR